MRRVGDELVRGPGTGRKWSARRHMKVRAQGVLNLASGAIRLLQIPGSKHTWHHASASNDNGEARPVSPGRTISSSRSRKQGLS